MLQLQKNNIGSGMLVSLICMIMILSGCGGGSDSASDTTTPTQPVVQSLKVEGSLLGGPVQKASVRVTDSNNQLVGNAEVSDSGGYKMALSGDRAVSSEKAFPLKIEMTGGTDKFFGNDPLSVYRSLVTDKSVTMANIGTLTTLIYDTAVSEAGGLASVTPAILDDATGKVLKIFGFGIGTGIDPIRTPIDSGNAASVIRASQALNELLMRLGKTPDERNLILTAWAEDICDGKLDGKKSDAALASALPAGVSANELCAATHVQIAAISADIMANALRLTQSSRNVLSSAETSDRLAEAVSTVAGMTKSDASAKLNALTVTENEIGQALSSVNIWIRLTGKDTLAAQLYTALAGIRAGQSAETVATALAGISLADLKTSADSTATDIFRKLYTDIQLHNAIHNVITLISVNVIPAESSVVQGKTVQFRAEGKYSDDSAQDISAKVNWSSSDTAVASIASGGLATAAAPGTVTIHAELNDIIGSAKLTVNAEITSPVLVSVQVMPQSASPEAGKTVQFKAIGTYKDGTTQDITAQVKWSSSDTAVATVSATGLSSALKAGTADIQAELDDITGSAKLTVMNPSPVLISLQITPANPSAETGKTTQFRAVGTYKDGTTQDITTQAKWSSSDTAVATVNAAGLATTIAAGTAVITAELNGITGSSQMAVTLPYYGGGGDYTPYVPPVRSLVSVRIAPASVTTVPGRTQQFNATGIYSDNTTEDITTKAAWSSSATAVATVDADGLATPIADGVASITATLSGVSASATMTVQAVTPPIYNGTETTFNLKRGGPNQFLLPVEVGNQTLNLLVDTGSNALLVFEDRLAPSNIRILRDAGPVTMTDMRVSKSYSSAKRSGMLANAPIRIGAYFAPSMRIMVIQSPDSLGDPSLTPKGADGIIGLRRTEGLTLMLDKVVLDVPLGTLMPSVSIFELDLPPAGQATLTLGKMPVLDNTGSQFVFRAKTLAVKDPLNPVSASYCDFQVPFRAKSSYGEAAETNLDILLDTGAVSKLVLDTKVAEKLGYIGDGKWNIPDTEEIEFNILGPDQTVTLSPKFKVSEISVAPYSEMGVEFEAVLGISRWQEYVVGFNYTDYQNGGPDGTISMLHRPDKNAQGNNQTDASGHYAALTGLNSLGDDRFASSDNTGSTVVFQSNRPGGKGGWDIYVWKNGALLTLPDTVNTAGDDSSPRITGDGRYIVFQSDRAGGLGSYDIYMFDLTTGAFVPLPGLNSSATDRTPVISRDGRYIAFRSERSGGAGGSDIYLYDRNTSSLVNLPGLNSAKGEYSPSLSGDGRWLAYESDRNGNSQVYLYDVLNKQPVTLSSGMDGFNSAYSQQAPALSADGRFMAFHTNRYNPEMGMNNRAVVVADIASGKILEMPGLNSSGDESEVTFSGDGNLIFFHSDRTGGTGGSDIYSYRLWTSTASGTKPVIQGIALKNVGTGFAIPVTVGGQSYDLLADNGLSAVVLFTDKVQNTLYQTTADDITLKFPDGKLLTGKIGTANISVGTYQASAVSVVLTNSANYTAIGGNITGVIGIFGMRYNRAAGDMTGTTLPTVPMAALQPSVSMYELDADPAGNARLTLNGMPAIGAVSESLVFTANVKGVFNQTDPLKSYTDTDVPFLAARVVGDQAANKTAATWSVMLSTTLSNRLILDKKVAAELGYLADQNKWPDPAGDIFIFLQGPDSVMRAGLPYPVSQIEVRDLGTANYQAVMSLDRWQNYVIGFDFVGPAAGGPSGVVSFLNRADMKAPQTGTGPSHQMMSLPGLNSDADDSFGDISDDGTVIAFNSNRAGGKGGYDIYLYRYTPAQNTGALATLPANLNSSADDIDPSLSASGNLLAFASNRSGNYNIYLYDLASGQAVDLPGLNTDADEIFPEISKDGKLLAFQKDAADGNSDIFVYDIANKTMLMPFSGIVNSSAPETSPGIGGDGNLISFSGYRRDDSKGGYDVYLFDRSTGKLRNIPNANSQYDEGSPRLSSDGKFMAFSGNRQAPDMGHNGRDIYLLEISSGELLFMPGLNSSYEENGPAITPGASYVLFHSKRPEGKGDYDIYLYKRDVKDTTVYTTTESYTQTGYVEDAQNVRVENATVRAYDAKGVNVATATSNANGNFTMTIPVGSQLPIQFQVQGTGTGLKAVTDDVGDDTYVPDFTAGNLKFTQVWIEDKAQTGFPTTIKFDIETTTPFSNIYAKVHLKQGNPSDVQLNNGIGFVPDYTLTGLVIEKLGQQGADIADPVVKTQKDMTTTVTYVPGTGNSKAHVEHTFIVPNGIPDGIYTAVFEISTLNINPTDNSIQGETAADQSDNYLVASAATIIGNPDKPNLRILSAKLLTSSFELPADIPAKDTVPSPPTGDLTLNMEVESMAQDTTQPIDIIFELELGGQKYPLSFFEVNDQGQPVKSLKQTYPSLLRQRQTGKTYNLFINDAVYFMLSSLTSNITCDLVITMDPNNTIAEYLDNKADNVMRMPVMFLAKSDTAARDLRGGPYANTWFDYSTEDSSGNDDFGIGYKIGPKLTYDKVTYNNTEYPSSAYFNGDNEIWAKVFGYRLTVLNVGAKFDFYGKDIIQSYFDYGVTVLDTRVYGNKYYVPSYFASQDEILLWKSIDIDGNELYAKSVEKTYEKTFTVGPVPITVKGGVVGEGGIRGEVWYKKPNKLVFEGGPFINVRGLAEGGIGFPGFSAGVGIELTLLELALKLTPSVQILPDFPIAIFRFDAPIVISTLDGRVYVFLRTFAWEYEYDIVAWDGFSWEYHFFPQQFVGFGAGDIFKTNYYNNTTWSGTPANTTTLWEGLIDHNWGSGGYSLGTGSSSTSEVITWETPHPVEGDADYAGVYYKTQGTLKGGNYRFTIDKKEVSSCREFRMEIKDSTGFTKLIWIANDGLNYNGEIKYLNYRPGSSAFQGTLSTNTFTFDDAVGISLRYGPPQQSVGRSYCSYDTYYGWRCTCPDSSLSETADGVKVIIERVPDAPPPATPTDNFSASWEGYFTFRGWDEYIWANDAGSPYTASYTFYKNSDEPMTAWMDMNDNGKQDSGEVLFDKDSGSKSTTVSVPVGIHYIQAKYAETTGNALAKIYWTKPNQFGAWYYNTKDLSGDPVYFETTEGIDYNWNSDGPKKNIVYTKNFSAKWEGTFDFPVGTDYIFYAVSYEGIRVYVDDAILIDGWSNTSSQTFSQTKNLTQGSHKVRVEYTAPYGYGLKVYWAPKSTFVGRYYSDTSFKTLSETMNEWTSGAYITYDTSNGRNRGEFRKWSSKTNFTARYEGAFWFNAGDVDFVSVRNDGMKVWVDDEVLFAKWDKSDKITAELSQKTMTAGWHRIRIDYVNYNGTGLVNLKWTEHKNNEWTATYYDGTGASKVAKDIVKESPATFNQPYEQPELGIRYDWGDGKPGNTVLGNNFPSDNFTVVWEGDFDFEAKPYLFIMRADDRATVWVDNIKVLETKKVNYEYGEAVNMNSDGINKRHRVRVEFAEDGGYANMRLSWKVLDPNFYFSGCFKNTDFKGDSLQQIAAFSSGINIDSSATGILQPCENPLSSDRHSLRLTGSQYFEEGLNSFKITTDGSVSLWIDGVGVNLSSSNSGSYKVYTGSAGLTKGPHTYKIEYVQSAGNIKIQFDSPTVQKSGVCVYTEPNYTGTSRCFNDGSDIANLSDYGLNDKISSVKVIGGSWCMLTSDSNFEGSYAQWGNLIIPDLSTVNSSLNKQASSLKVRSSSWTPGVVGGYQNTNYGGTVKYFIKGEQISWASSDGWYNAISSVKIWAGSPTVTLYWNSNYQGATYNITSSIPDLRTAKNGSSNWNDNACSLKVQ